MVLTFKDIWKASIGKSLANIWCAMDISRIVIVVTVVSTLITLAVVIWRMCDKIAGGRCEKQIAELRGMVEMLSNQVDKQQVRITELEGTVKAQEDQNKKHHEQIQELREMLHTYYGLTIDAIYHLTDKIEIVYGQIDLLRDADVKKEMTNDVVDIFSEAPDPTYPSPASEVDSMKSRTVTLIWDAPDKSAPCKRSRDSLPKRAITHITHKK